MNSLQVSKSIKKKIWHFTLNLLLVILAIPPSLTLLFVSPMVQTISAKLANHILSKNLHHKIELQRIQIGLFTGISIDDLKIRDNKGNLLIGAQRLNTMPIFADIINNKLIFNTVSLDGVVFNMGTYIGDTTTNLNSFIYSITGKSGKSRSVGQEPSTFKLQINKVTLTNSHFRLFDEEGMSDNTNSMDYRNIVVDSINANISNFSIVDDSLHFMINSMSAVEKCGLKVIDFKTDFHISSTGLIANKAIVKIGSSTINADFGLHTRSYQTYSSYIDSVVMKGNFRPSTVNMADIGYFAEIMYQMPNVVSLSGYVEGTVADMNGSNLRIKYGRNTRVSGNISMKGLPDFFDTKIHWDSLSAHMTTGDLKSFHLPIEDKFVDLTSLYPANERLILTGSFDGYYEDFSANIQIATSIGSIQSAISFIHKEGDTTGFTLLSEGKKVNVGKLIKREDLIGISSFNVSAQGTGKAFNNLHLVSSGTINNTRLLNYKFQQIKYNLDYQSDSALVNINVLDTNLIVDVKSRIRSLNAPKVNLTANLKKANLNHLGLLSKPELVIASNISAVTTGMDLDSIIANISLQKTRINHGLNVYTIDSISLEKIFDKEGNTHVSLQSEIVDFSASGHYMLTTIGNSINNLLDHYYDFDGIVDSCFFVTDKDIEVAVLIKKPEILQRLIFPGLTLSPKTTLNGKLFLPEDSVFLKVYSPNIGFQGVKFDSNLLVFHTRNKKLVADYSALRVILKDSLGDDKTVFGIDDLSISARLGKDSILYGVYWNNRDTLLKNIGLLEGYVATYEDTTYMNIGKTHMVINDSIWTIDTSNLIVMAGNRVFFNNIDVVGGTSELKINGTLPKVEGDSLVAEFDHWDLSNFDILMRQYQVDLDGSIDGQLQLTMIKENPTFVSNLTISDLTFNNEYLGRARLLNTWDNTTNGIFIKSQITREGNSGVGEVFSADGYYYPFRDEDNLNVKIEFNRIKLKGFEPFLIDFVQQIEGTTSGSLAISGSTSMPIVKGSAKLQRTSMIVNYLNTRYSFSNSIDFEQNAISFNNLVLYDTIGNKANVSGKLEYNNRHDPQFDVVVNTDKLLFFNTTRGMNDMYYGTAIASGFITLKGSPNNIHLAIKSETRKGTYVNLPLSYSVEISDKDYIVFVNSIDSTAELDAIKNIDRKRNSQSKFDISIDMGVTPEAGVAISLPSDMGKIEARGSGDLNMLVNSDGDFNLAGDYIVDNGTFLFTIGNLVNKRFSLVNGGRISWTGSPYTANMNIKGLYRVKTNLNSLGIEVDSTVNYKNKVAVNCYIMLTNELLNPDMHFRISFPDLDPDIQRMIFAELDTNNAAMMNQQMISLLVLGTFSFNNASNINLAGSYYGIIANQLSGMLSQISDAVDIGVNYKPGDDVSQEEFEVALSTQLFDDRLTIDGNFGMTYSRSQQSASNLVGDVNIGYKLTPDGRWVLKVFNHSNVNSWYSYNSYDQVSPYTQGIGIAFRKEFNNISEFFINSRKREKMKQKNNPEKKSDKEPQPEEKPVNE